MTMTGHKIVTEGDPHKPEGFKLWGTLSNRDGDEIDIFFHQAGRNWFFKTAYSETFSSISNLKQQLNLQ